MTDNEIEILAEEVLQKINVFYNNLNIEDSYKLSQELLILLANKRSCYGQKLSMRKRNA